MRSHPPTHLCSHKYSLSLPLSSYIFRAAPLAPNLTTDKESLLPPSFAHDGRPGNKSTLPREVIIIILSSLACGCYIHANFIRITSQTTRFLDGGRVWVYVISSEFSIELRRVFSSSVSSLVIPLTPSTPSAFVT